MNIIQNGTVYCMSSLYGDVGFLWKMCLLCDKYDKHAYIHYLLTCIYSYMYLVGLYSYNLAGAFIHVTAVSMREAKALTRLREYAGRRICCSHLR